MSSPEWAIRSEGLSKKFGLTLKQSMKYGLQDAARRLIGKSETDSILREGEFWAVSDVNLELKAGEALGIMGVNGCGKTTLLRILYGVYSPDRGYAQVRGRVGAIMAAGAGFAPMLSGRENVYINGALLGLSTREIDGLMDEIIAFSELGQFIDLPVKNYSSGMHVRLGFAIAALSRPDVLLMDEILAVGDLNFQKKCFDHILKLKHEGTAIVLVSHSPGAIWSVCDRSFFMNSGRVVLDGSVEDAIRAYDDQNAHNAAASSAQFDLATQEHEQKTAIEEAVKNENSNNVVAIHDNLASSYGHSRGGSGEAICDRVQVFREDGKTPGNTVSFGETVIIKFDITVFKRIEKPIFRTSIDAVHYKFIVSLDSIEHGMEMDFIEPGKYQLVVKVLDQCFRPGMYTVNTSVLARNVGVHIFYWLSAASFVVSHPQDIFLYSNDKAVYFIPCNFKLESVNEISTTP